MKTTWRLTVAVLVAGGLAVEAQRKSEPVDKQEQKAPDASEVKTDGLPVSVDPKSYRIGPEDVLRLEVYNEPQLSGSGLVRPDGNFTVNLVGDVQVNGLTPAELKAKLTAEFGKLVNSPLVTVSVMAVRSKKYYISGQVARTGLFPLVVPVTILEALTMAGGPTEWANKKKIVIMRGEKRFFFNWNDVIKGKNLTQNIYIENGDFIIVN